MCTYATSGDFSISTYIYFNWCANVPACWFVRFFLSFLLVYFFLWMGGQLLALAPLPPPLPEH